MPRAPDSPTPIPQPRSTDSYCGLLQTTPRMVGWSIPSLLNMRKNTQPICTILPKPSVTNQHFQKNYQNEAQSTRTKNETKKRHTPMDGTFHRGAEHRSGWCKLC